VRCRVVQAFQACTKASRKERLQPLRYIAQTGTPYRSGWRRQRDCRSNAGL